MIQERTWGFGKDSTSWGEHRKSREKGKRERTRGRKEGRGKTVQSTRGVYVSESELRVLRLALVMPQVVMLGHILESQCGAVFGEAKQRGKESGVQVDVVADVNV